MKKLFFAYVILFTVVVNAQQAVLGAKAGVNFSTLYGENVSGLEGRTGFHLGLVAELEVSEFFSIQPEILYSGLGASEGETSLGLDYISVPFMAQYYIGQVLFLEAGPQISFNVVAQAESYGESKEIEGIELVEFAAALGAGLQLPAGVFVQARYVLGINEALEYPRLKNNVLQLSVGYKI